MNIDNMTETELDIMINLIQKEQLSTNLHTYIKKAWEVIEPGIDFIDNWHIECICEYLEAVSLGQINRLLINMPPRYMKSIAVTVGWPTWAWTSNPYERFISLSYSASLSKKHNINRRDIIKSPWYQKNWGDKFSLKADMDTQMKFENDKMGFMFATSIGGTLTGEGGDYIIVDDPHNPTQAQSDVERESALEFYKTTLPTRLNDKKKGAIVVVMQRLHEDDISGYCLKEGGYTHLCLPGIAEERQIITFPVSLRQIIREEKDVLWPEREGQKELDEMKKALGTYGFSGQYQQSPSPSEGGTFKKWWWRYWKPKGMSLPPVPVKDKDGNTYNIEAIDLPDKFDRKLQSWDLAFKKKEDSDFISGQAWANKGASIFMLDCINERMSFTETLKAIEDFSKKHPDIILKLIEDKANGPAIIDMLHHVIGGIVPIEPEGSKEARAEAVTPIVEAGNVYLPHPLIFEWVNEFIEQTTKFPKVTHDDMCFIAGTKIATIFGDKVIENVKIGEYVLTPFGIRKVTNAGFTGEKEVVTCNGLTGTKNHPVFTYESGFIEMDALTQALNNDKISLGGVLKWRYKKLLYLMESNTDLWGREGIILASQKQIKEENVLKDFMLQFGNFITKKRFKKAMKFITKMVIVLITTLATWSVFQLVNIINFINLKILKNKKDTWNQLETKQKNGTRQKRAGSGILNIGETLLGRLNLKNAYVNFAKKNTSQSIASLDFVPIIVKLNGIITIIKSQLKKNVLFAEKNLKQKEQIETQKEVQYVACPVEENLTGRIEKVYNLTIEKDHVYYANGLLVSNCDAMSQALYRFIYAADKVNKPKLPDNIPSDLRQDLESNPEAMQHWLQEHGLL